MQLFLVKKNGYYSPAYEEDIEASAKIPNGEVIAWEKKNWRNPRFHRKYFAMLDFAAKHLPEGYVYRTPKGTGVPIRTKDDLLYHIKMAMGHYELKMQLSGEMNMEAKSIAVANMDEVEFDKFYYASIDILEREFFNDRPETIEEIITLFANY